MSELVVRRWPDSPRARELAADQRAAAEARKGLTADELLTRARASRRASTGYFIKVAGTGENPIGADWAVPHRAWLRKYGDLSMFPRRPQMKWGDRHVHYAAGSQLQFGEGRIFLVSQVLSHQPEPAPHDRWPWMVRTRSLIAGPRLERCPRISEIGVELRSLRRQSHIHLTDEQGELAEALIARAAERYGSLLDVS
jgi:hypothetical protein